MSASLIAFIVQYGYLAVFSLIFLQELGVPNPVPNEFILLYAGYLASIGTLHFSLVFLVAVAADCLGTTALYFAFYFFGKALLKRQPKWLPISKARIEKISGSLSKKRWWGIYLGRLIPYLRGYTSVAAGLLEIKPRVFIPTVLLSAITWSGGYVIVGKLAGPRWHVVTKWVSGSHIFILLITGIVVFFLVRRFLSWHKKR
jgi:membrane protein DedA with SNARE-associated domain